MDLLLSFLAKRWFIFRVKRLTARFDKVNVSLYALDASGLYSKLQHLALEQCDRTPGFRYNSMQLRICKALYAIQQWESCLKELQWSVQTNRWALGKVTFERLQRHYRSYVEATNDRRLTRVNCFLNSTRDQMTVWNHKGLL